MAILGVEQVGCVGGGILQASRVPVAYSGLSSWTSALAGASAVRRPDGATGAGWSWSQREAMAEWILARPG